jgi:hypothetical protein
VKAARSLKLAGALVVAALAVTGLSACQSRVGAAAYVGSTRISESTVGKYVNRNATETTDQSTGALESPKSEVLDTLIINELIDRVIASKPSFRPSGAALDAARTTALTQIGAPSVAALETGLESAGFTKSFADFYLDEQAKISLLTADLKDTDGSVLFKAVNDLHVKVSVSPRYGDWNETQLSVSTGPSTPSFLTLATDDNPSGVGAPTAG